MVRVELKSLPKAKALKRLAIQANVGFLSKEATLWKLHTTILRLASLKRE